MICPARERKCANHRDAFTLIEVLLALGLTSILLVAVTGALYQYYSLSFAGDRQIERTRNQLCFVQQLRQDALESTREESSLQRRFELEGVAQVASSNIGERVLELNTDYPIDPIALYGETDFIAFGSMKVLPIQGKSSSRSLNRDYRLTVWTSTLRKTIPISFANRDASLRSRILTLPEKPLSQIPMKQERALQGGQLVRLEISTIEQPRVIGDSRFTESIEAITFRYLGPTGWVDRWDSSNELKLPDRIEVKVRFADSEVELSYSLNFPKTSFGWSGGKTS